MALLFTHHRRVYPGPLTRTLKECRHPERSEGYPEAQFASGVFTFFTGGFTCPAHQTKQLNIPIKNAPPLTQPISNFSRSRPRLGIPSSRHTKTFSRIPAIRRRSKPP